MPSVGLTLHSVAEDFPDTGSHTLLLVLFSYFLRGTSFLQPLGFASSLTVLSIASSESKSDFSLDYL